MLVSIYMPTRNRVELLRRAVESVRRQTYRNIELWVVDDGSTDGTQEYLQQVSAIDERVHFIRNDISGGAPRARNAAIGRTRGELVTGLDDDDTFHEQRIEKLMGEWQRLEAAGERFSCLYTQDVMASGERMEISRKAAIVEYEDLFFYNLIGNQIFTRRERFIDAGLFDERMPAWQDLDMFMRVVEKFGPARLLDEPLYTLELAPRNDRISVSTQRVAAAYERLASKVAQAPRELQQGLFLQRFGRLYGFKMSAQDLRSFWRFGIHPRTLKRLCGILARQFLTRDAPSSAATVSPPLRVLMFPKFSDNPYLSLLTQRLEQRGVHVEDFTFARAFRERWDVIHIHWPDLHLKARTSWRGLAKQLRLAIAFSFARMRNSKIVWTIHNLTPHERHHSLPERVFPLWYPRSVTHVIAMTTSGLQAAYETYRSLRSKHAAVIPHGHYRHAYPSAIARQDALQHLRLPARFTFLFFGNIRPYKNVPRLIEAFRSLERDDVQLLIVGQPGGGMEVGQLMQLVAGDERIHLRLEFVSERDVPIYLGAANVVVLPFDNILNSGSALLALSFNRPVLAPRLGSLPEIQQRVGARWVELYDGALATHHLALALREAAIGEDEVVDLAQFDWDVIGQQTLDFYGATNSADVDIGAQRVAELSRPATK